MDDIVDRLSDATDRDRISDAQEEILALRNKVADQHAEIESLNIRIKELERAVSDGLAVQRRLQRQVHADWLVDKYGQEEDTK